MLELLIVSILFLFILYPRMKETDEKNFPKRIATLAQNKEYENPKVTPEGYGTFICPSMTPEDTLNKAKTLKAKGDALNNRDSINLYLESLFLYLKQTSKSQKEDIKVYLSTLKYIIKFAEHIIGHALKFEDKKTVRAIEWALFNLKLIKLMKESDILSKNPDLQFYLYILDSLKSMESYRASNDSQSIELVDIEDLEDGIKGRL